MERKDHNDISAYLLFEATGDSEDSPTMDGVTTHEFPINAVDNDDDDAESCSYGGSENICDIDRLVNGYEPAWDVDDDDGGDVKKADTDEEEVTVYGISYCTDDEVEEHRKSGAVDLVPGQQELIDEREKNRLFWEACLAS